MSYLFRGGATDNNKQIHAHLKQSAVVGETVFSIPAGVVHLVSPAGQHQLIGAV